jgi:anhydro-N-acetylmuramic acid kinase
MDLALGGQGAPIVPIGEKLLLGDFGFFLNLGGIANISIHDNDSNARKVIAFDVCPANRVLNLLSNRLAKEYDEGGAIARSGQVQQQLLARLEQLDYYAKPYPKSLANDFGTDVVYPIITEAGSSIPDALRTMVEHIVQEIKKSIRPSASSASRRLLATGGGALNIFLVDRLREVLKELNVEVIIPDENIVKYKESLIMALMGVLRWREENNVLSSVTGAARDSIGGAVWIGQEA